MKDYTKAGQRLAELTNNQKSLYRLKDEWRDKFKMLKIPYFKALFTQISIKDMRSPRPFYRLITLTEAEAIQLIKKNAAFEHDYWQLYSKKQAAKKFKEQYSATNLKKKEPAGSTLTYEQLHGGQKMVFQEEQIKKIVTDTEKQSAEVKTLNLTEKEKEVMKISEYVLRLRELGCAVTCKKIIDF